MAYEIDQRTGLPSVGGVPLPLTPEQMAAAGSYPAPVPMPDVRNPYAGLPPDAVAGIGGGPVVQMSGGDISAPMSPTVSQGPGVPFAQQSPDPYARFRVHLDPGGPPPDTSGLAAMAARQQAAIDMRRGMSPTEAAAQSAAGDVPPALRRYAEKVEPQRPGAAPGSAPLQLIPTVGDAQAPTGGTGASAEELAQQQRIFDKTLAGGAGGGRAPKLGVTGETVKRTEYGAVPQALSEDIADQQADIDRQQAAANDMGAVAATSSLRQQADVIRQQQADAADAAARRQAVDQRIQQLSSKSDADEAALSQARPKQAQEFWGGSRAAEVISALSVALGAGVQARTGHNPAQEMLDRTIDRWVADQRQQYEAAKDKATLSNNRYKDALQTYGTPEAAQAQLRLQALAAKNAMAQNMAEQSKVPSMLANAQLMQQRDQLQRKQLKAESIAKAGMREVEERMTPQGGTGSAADRELLALRRKAETKELQDKIGGRTNEDKRTDAEVSKTKGAGLAVSTSASDAADAVAKYQRLSSSALDRATPETRGQIAAAKEEAVSAYSAYLTASKGAGARAAREAAEKFLGAAGDVARGPSSDSTLRSLTKNLRGNAARAAAAHASGTAPQISDDEIGETE